MTERPEHEQVTVDHPHEADALPAPTSGPLLFAFGTTLVFTGLVTSWMISVAGGLVAIWGVFVWWWDVFPRERMESIPDGHERPVNPPATVSRSDAEKSPGRLVLPIEVPRYSSGIKGGLAGGVAMGVVALAWGLILHRSIWLPINLLAGMVLPSIETESLAELGRFDGLALLTGVGIHVFFSLLVGLLFGVAAPMLPRHPILFGGLIAPVLWSGLVHASIKVLDPALGQYINWWWFVASQLAFGLMAGWVVSRTEQVSTLQYLTPAERLDLETGRTGTEDSS